MEYLKSDNKHTIKKIIEYSKQLDKKSIKELIDELGKLAIDEESTNYTDNIQLGSDYDCMEQLPYGFIVVDFKFNIVFANQYVLNVFNASKTDVLMKNFRNILDNDNFELFTKFISSTAEGNFNLILSIKIDINETSKLFRIYSIPNTELTDFYKLIFIDQTEEISVRKDYQKALENFKNIFENVQDVFYQIDLNGIIMEISPSIKYHSNYTREEIIGSTVTNIYFDKNDREKLLNIIYETGELHEYEVKLSTKQDEIKYVSINAKLVKDSAGLPLYITGVLRDITKKKISDESLRASEELFRAVSEYSFDSICILDTNGKIVWANEAMLRMSGYSHDQIMDSQSFADFIAPDSLDFVIPNFLKFVNNEEYIHRYIFNYIKSDGEIRTCEKYMTDLIDSNGEKKLVVSMNDITDRLLAEENIKKVSRFYQSLIDNAPDGVVLINAAGDFQFISPSAYRLFNYLPEEITVFHPNDLTHPDDLPDVLYHLGLLMKNPEYTPKIEYRFLEKNGDWIWIESTFTNLLNDPNVEAIIINFRNISERKQVEQELIYSEQNYRAIFNSSTEAIFIDDANTGKMIDVNDTMLKMYGYDTREEVLSGNIGNLSANIEPYTDDKAVEYIMKTINEGQQTFEWLAKRKDNTTFWIEMTLKTAVIAGKDIIIAVGRDITERKITEQKLVENEEKYRALVENSLEGIALLELGGTIIFANSTSAKIFETPSPDILIGRNVFELLPHESISKVTNDFNNVLNGIDSYLENYKCNTFTGKEIWIESIGKRIQYEGRMVSLLSFRDITEKIQSEKARKKSEELFKSVVNNSTNLNIISSPEGISTFISPQCETVIGYPAEMFLGSTFPNIIHPDDVEMCQKQWQQVHLYNISINNIEYRIIDNSGNIRWLSHSATPIIVNDEIIGFQNTVQNITDRKESELALQKSEALLRSIIENATFEVWARDIDNIGILENNKFTLHYDSIIGRLPDEAPDGIKQKWVANNNRVFSGQLINEDADFPFNNIIRTYHQIIFPIYNNDLITGIAGFNIDITDKKKAEERMAKLTSCLLSFGNDMNSNINNLVVILGETLGASCALYNRLNDNKLFVLGKWNAPADLVLIDKPEGHICYDIITKTDKEPVIINNLHKTEYYITDSNVKKYNLITYAGISVKCRDNNIGSLCVLFQYETDISQDELEFMKIVSFAIAIEEERKLAEDTLIKSFMRNQALLTAIPDMMFVFDSKGVIIDFYVHENDPLFVEPKHFLNKNIKEVFPIELVNSTMIRIENVLLTANTDYLMYDLVINNETKYFESRYVKQSDNEVVAIVREITDRVLAEQELLVAREKALENEKRLLTFINSIPDIVVYKDGDGRWLLANDAELDLFNLKNTDYYGKTDIELSDYTDIMFTPTLKNCQLSDEAAWQNGSPTRGIEEIPTIDGINKVFDIIKVPVYYLDNSRKGLAVIGRDITELQETQIELKKEKIKAQESEQKYKQIFDNTLDCIFILNVTKDKRFTILTINNAQKSIIGSDQDFSGMYLEDVLPYEVCSQVVPHYQKCMFEKSIITYEEFVDFNNNLFYFKTQLIPFLDDNYNVYRIIGITQNITENKLLTNQLLQKNKELEALNLNLTIAKNKAEENEKLKTAFLANMSHEIRTPMNGILGFARLLKEPDLTAKEIDDYIDLIQKSGKRMLNIINDIIDLSKIESGQMELNLDLLSIRDQIIDVYNFFLPEAKEKLLDFILELPDNSISTIINSDKVKIYAILQNLVKNAIKFTNTGFIKISLSLNKDFYQISVQDSGVGIPRDIQRIIFDRFRQGSEALSRNYEGAGLGLSITKAYVEMLGGQITVISDKDKGSSFVFTIPTFINQNEKSDKITTYSNNNFSEIKSGATILVAEDDIVSANLIKTVLKRAGFNVLNTNNGLSAVELVKASKDIVLVLMDIKMPEMNGYEAIKEIRKFNQSIKIIAQTAYALKGDEERALEIGADAYLSKPIDIIKLKSLLNELL